MSTKALRDLKKEIDEVTNTKNIPTRNQIIKKIDQLIKNKKLNREDYFRVISEWLDGLGLPEFIEIAGKMVNPKDQILDDLNSYSNY